MIVVSDTSPLCYLTLIDCIKVLPQLFGEVAVPRMVWIELTHPDSPEAVRILAAEPPIWLKVYENVARRKPMPSQLDPGETAAILLAQELRADGLLIDDARGKAVAEASGLRVTGTLGVLRLAARAGRIDFVDGLTRLRQTNFRASASLFEALIEEEQKRLRRQG